jgi:nucleoside-diphosphate-sugar epimerase
VRVYVTGGTGFVGSNIVKLYSEWHGLVVGAARRLPDIPFRARFIEVDLLDEASVRASVSRAAPT